jgi:magnesium transporter
MSSLSELTLSFLRQRPQQAAAVLDDLESADVAAFVADIPHRIAGPAVGHMLRWRAAACFEHLAPDQAAGLIENMDYYDAVGLMKEVEPETRRAVLAELSRALAQKIEASLRYPEGTVGTLMDAAAPIFSLDATVEQALRYVRQRRFADISHVFVHGAQGRFEGSVSVAALVRAAEDSKLASLVRRQVSPISNRATLTSIAHDPEWDDYPMRPVVGTRQALVGGLSRSVLRRRLSQPASARMRLEPAGLLANMFEMYLYTFQGLVELAAKPTDLEAPFTGDGGGHDRQH